MLSGQRNRTNEDGAAIEELARLEAEDVGGELYREPDHLEVSQQECNIHFSSNVNQAYSPVVRALLLVTLLEKWDDDSLAPIIGHCFPY